MKLRIFTAADRRFFPLFKGLLDSIDAARAQHLGNLYSGDSHFRVHDVDVVLFDLGLLPHMIQEAMDRKVLVVPTSRIDPHSFYGDAYRDSLTPATLALLIRPELPRWRGDADVLMYVDADAWFADHEAIEDFAWAASQHTLAIVPETGRIAAYGWFSREVIDVQWYDTEKYFGPGSADALANLPLLNAGVIAAEPDNPVWDAWHRAVGEALVCNDGLCEFGIDQCALNYVVYAKSLRFNPMPFSHNYCASQAIPVLRGGRLCFPTVPYEPIHVLHMTGNSKFQRVWVSIIDEPGDIADHAEIYLDYGAVQELSQDLRAVKNSPMSKQETRAA